ncbi:DUF4349 domain-containing protein [Streptomyces silvensis]|uniref:DUF4349 domain-containing protein n=1 Tax=Streptomyces silvensis TaxID=1765722 RepID=UPI00099E321E|nr:DUF4349 domain-containing protein [Streptomyces silvensis]
MHSSSTTGTHGTSRRRRAAPAALLLALALALAGCGGADDADSGGDAAAARQDTAKGPAGPGGGQADADQEGGRAGDRAGGHAGEAGAAKGREGGKPRRPGGVTVTRPSAAPASHVIRTASLTVRVKDVPRAVERARTVAEDAGGLVGDESTDRGRHGDDRSRVVLRVPQDRYGQVLSELAGAGRLVSRSAKAEDVTEQVVDVESRIRTQRASVARVRALMDRATRIGDIVSLEGELSSRQSDLESLLAQQASLKDRTAMATITLTLTESPRPSAAGGDDDGTSFADALSGGWGAFVTMLGWVAVALAAALPFAAVVALLALLWLRVARPRLARRGPAESAGPEAARATGTPGGPGSA